MLNSDNYNIGKLLKLLECKDAKIAELQEQIAELKNIKTETNNICHEICETIREECVYVIGTKKICDTCISAHSLNEILNEIEGKK